MTNHEKFKYLLDKNLNNLDISPKYKEKILDLKVSDTIRLISNFKFSENQHRILFIFDSGFKITSVHKSLLSEEQINFLKSKNGSEINFIIEDEKIVAMFFDKCLLEKDIIQYDGGESVRRCYGGTGKTTMPAKKISNKNNFSIFNDIYSLMENEDYIFDLGDK